MILHKSRILLSILIAVLFSYFVIEKVQAANPSEKCSVATGLLKKGLPKIAISNLSEEDIEKAVMARVCVHSYPWPKGVFLTEETDEKTGVTTRAITADEMGELASKVEYAVDTSDFSRLDAESKDDLQLHLEVHTNIDQIKPVLCSRRTKLV
jgi:hypothetical protein